MAECSSMGYEDCSTQLALLFPLRTGLFSVRSGSSTSLPPPQREMAVTGEEAIEMRQARGRQARRRGSSMSELDRFQMAHLQNSHEHHTDEEQAPMSLGTPKGSGYDTAPHSPAFTRRNLMEESVRGSIGDLMNLKQYGSMWSVRSATESIAQAVPLTTVTQRKMAVHETMIRATAAGHVCDQAPQQQECLTTSQRTERLSRLIRKQQSYKPATAEKVS
ncbi:hypothetical protein B566_EDAN005887 [Ephemera danica]|nr:hypothetical protein B566_EDAN005887 [Ephemera danica]